MRNQKQPRKIKHIYIDNRVYEVVNGFTERKEMRMKTRQSNEQICANCAYTQGRQSWCDGKNCKKIKK